MMTTPAHTAESPPPPPRVAIEQRIKALEFFKDWSNYLLVTTVAAIGWVAEHPAEGCRTRSLWCFAISVAFGIFTLALVPLVAEEVDERTSIYSVTPSYARWNPVRLLCIPFRITFLCMPQHLFFLAGIALYVISATCSHGGAPATRSS